MTDRYDHDLLLDYLEGDLDAGPRAQVEQMLAEDPQLAALMRGLEADREMLRSLPSEQAPDDLGHDLVQGLERRMLLDAPQVDAGGPIPIQRGAVLAAPAEGFPWSRAIGVGSLAAAVALAAGLVFYVNNSGSLPRSAMDLSQSPTPPGAGENTGEEVAASAPGNADAAEGTARGNPPTTDAMRSANGVTDAQPNPDSAADARSRVERARDALLGGTSPLPPRADSPAALARENIAPADAALAGDDWPLGQTLLAFAALSPNQALRIESDDPTETRRQILDWCIDNNIPVVEQQFAKGNAYGDNNTDEPYALLIEEDQLDALVTRMNQAELAPARRQRAEVDTPVNAYNQQILRNNALNQAPQADGVGQQAQLVDDTLPPIVGLKVPEDLGDDALTQQNLANTLAYSNNDDLARTAQRNAEVIRNQYREDPVVSMANAAEEPADPGSESFLDNHQERGPGGLAGDNAPGTGRAGDPERSRAGDRSTPPPSRGGSRAGGSDDPANAPQEAEGDATGELDADISEDAQEESETQAGGGRGGAERDDTLELDEAMPADEEQADAELAEHETRVPAPRGNWLMPQVPLAPTTPLWTDPPAARLVPIVIIPQPAETPAPAVGEEASQPGTAEPGSADEDDAAETEAAPPGLDPAPDPDADE